MKNNKCARITILLCKSLHTGLHAAARFLCCQKARGLRWTSIGLVLLPMGGDVFAGGGAVDLNFSNTVNGIVRACTVDPSNTNVLIAGDFTSVGDFIREHVALLTSRGEVVPSFNAWTDGSVYTVARQASDGKFLIGGAFTYVNGVPRSRMARLNSDGTLDTSFAGPTINNTVRSLAVQSSDGKILAGGDFTQVATGGGKILRPSLNPYIARFLPNGQLESGFSPVPNYPVTSIAYQPLGGTIVIGGYFTYIGNLYRYYIAMLGPDGSVNTQFNPYQLNNYVYAVASQEATKIYMGGVFTVAGTQSRARIADMDNYGVPGCVGVQGGADAEVDAIAIESSGNLLVGGAFNYFNGQPRPRIARQNIIGFCDIDASFNAGTFYPTSNSRVLAISIQPDGNIIIGGQFDRIGSVPRSNIARLIAND